MRRNFLGTVLFAVLLTLYSAYIALNGLPLLWGTPEMATTGLTLGVLSGCVVGRDQMLRHHIAFAAALATIAVGVTAGFTQSDALLAVSMASLMSLWLFGLHVRRTTPAAHTRRATPSRVTPAGETSQPWPVATAPAEPAWARNVPSAA